MGAEFEAESGDVWMGGGGGGGRFVWKTSEVCRWGGEEGSDGCSLERSKGWMEEGGTEAP